MSLKHFGLGGGAGAAADTKGTSQKQEDEKSKLDEIHCRITTQNGTRTRLPCVRFLFSFLLSVPFGAKPFRMA